VKPLKDKIVHPKSGSYFQVISNVADAQHGANLHGYVSTSYTSTRRRTCSRPSRPAPAPVVSRSAWSSPPPTPARRETPYDNKRRRIEQLARGVLHDPSVYGVIFAAPEGADPHAEATWRAANPGFGVSPTRAYLVKASRKAESSPDRAGLVLAAHLGISTRQDGKYLKIEAWDRNAGLVDETALHGRETWGGLDLAATSDLCALVLAVPRTMRRHAGRRLAVLDAGGQPRVPRQADR
jgi:hypothetical protein